MARRRAAGTPPFTVLSCDNLPANGRVVAEGTIAEVQANPDVQAAYLGA